MADVVSRRRDPAEALLESEQLLTAYFSASKVGLCILDMDLRYLAINHTMAEMNGIPAEAHLGKSVREMLGDFAELIEPQLKRVLETRQPVLNLEISAVLPTRTEPGHWIEHYIPIKDATGKVDADRRGCGRDYRTEETRGIVSRRFRDVAGGEKAAAGDDGSEPSAGRKVGCAAGLSPDIRLPAPGSAAGICGPLGARRKERAIGPAGHGFSPGEGVSWRYRNQCPQRDPGGKALRSARL